MLKKAGGCLGPWVRLGLYLVAFSGRMACSWMTHGAPQKLMGLFDWPLGSRVLLVLLRWSLLALSSLALCQIFVKKSLRISASVSASYSPPVESTSISNIAPDTRHARARSSPHYSCMHNTQRTTRTRARVTALLVERTSQVHRHSVGDHCERRVLTSATTPTPPVCSEPCSEHSPRGSLSEPHDAPQPTSKARRIRPYELL